MSDYIKIDHEGQACRKCGTPVIRREFNPNKLEKKLKEDKAYYFEYYFFCKRCRTFYMVDEAKRYYTDENIKAILRKKYTEEIEVKPKSGVPIKKSKAQRRRENWEKRQQQGFKKATRKNREPSRTYRPGRDETRRLRRLVYKDYLKSDHWKRVREDALQRAKHKCQLCSSTTRLNVHHNTYKNLGCERPEDLFVLCEHCHSKFHNKLPKEPVYKTRFEIEIEERFSFIIDDDQDQ